MAFRSYPFPPETPLFPIADKVHQYFKDFSHHFSLRKHIKFSTSVTSVIYTADHPRRWIVQTSTNESYYFDLIMLCNGHHRIPQYPSTPGLSDWRSAQKVSHSVYYRRPMPVYKDKTLLIVGLGPSGYDLAFDLNGYAAKVILSGSNLDNSTDSSGIHFRPRLLSFGSPTSGTVTFADGMVEEGIDYCILATGYFFDFPFLQPPLIYNRDLPQSTLPRPHNLYNASYGIFPLAQHLWPLQTHFPPETMAFMGLLTRGTPPPLFETQARAVLRAFDTYTKGIENGDGMRGIDEQVEMIELIQRWERLKVRLGDDESVIKVWHRLDEPETYDYRDHLSIFAEREPLEYSGSTKITSQANQNPACQSDATSGSLDPDDIDILKLVVRVYDWERFGYTKKNILRRTWVKLEQSGESEKWLKDVGTNGMDDWADLMHKVADYENVLQMSRKGAVTR